jgi:uncharacterized repeat protein (TIGR01451 family)
MLRTDKNIANNDASIGGGGVLVLGFDVPLTGDGNPSTPDLWVWEVGQIAEGYRVDVSANGLAWTTVGQSNGSTNGSQGFDIDHAGFDSTSRLFFIRVTDTSFQDDGCQGGADVDAVAILSSIAPSITLTKSASPSSGVRVGDTVTFTFVVTNPGNDTLNNLSFQDPLPGLSAIDCGGVTSLSPFGSVTCTATYVVT